MTDRWAVADLRATAIMDVTRNARVAERNSRTLAEAAGLAAHNPAHIPGHGSGTEAAGLAAQAREPASTIACQHGSTRAREHGSTPPDGWLCIEFTVPAAPRGWEKPKPVGYGRTIKGQDERAWQSDIAKYARQAKAAAGATGLLRGGVRLSVIAYVEVPKSYRPARRADCLAGRTLPIVKPDWDRIENSVGDALTGVLWVDDKQVVAGSCLKVWAETGSLYVRVQAL